MKQRNHLASAILHETVQQILPQKPLFFTLAPFALLFSPALNGSPTLSCTIYQGRAEVSVSPPHGAEDVLRRGVKLPSGHHTSQCPGREASYMTAMQRPPFPL